MLLLACICQSIGDRYVEQTRRLRAIICKLNVISLELDFLVVCVANLLDVEVVMPTAIRLGTY